MNRSRIAAWICLLSSVSLAGLVLHRWLPPAPTILPTNHQMWPMDRGAWHPATSAEREEALRPVRGQLEAFRRDDYAAALHYHDGPMRGQFPTPAILRRAVTESYPEFAHPLYTRFGKVWVDHTGRHAGVPVHLTGQSGIEIDSLYWLTRGDGGDYKIDDIHMGRREPMRARGPHPAIGAPS